MPNGPVIPKPDTSGRTTISIGTNKSLRWRIQRIAELTGQSQHLVASVSLEWSIDTWEREHPVEISKWDAEHPEGLEAAYDKNLKRSQK
jgi:predicted transcriptional regulator